MKHHILTAAFAAAMLTPSITSARSLNGPDFTDAAENTVNGVVSIKSFATPRGYSSGGFDNFFSDPFFEYFFGSPRGNSQRPQAPESEQRQTGLGSGVILSEDGYIVSNNHVIDGAERLEVTLNDNRTFNATVIGADEATDLALIKIDADNLHVIPMGDSEALKVGEWVLAVGNPFGLTSSVTAGIVSAKARNISSMTQGRTAGIESYIQTDAAVNPGNSGGALVNLDGELVGINAAIYSQTGNYSGSSFAIPTSIVSKVVKDIMEYGTVQRAILGVQYQELTPQLAKEHDITAVAAGLYVAKVVERSAAFEAGIKEGDVIVGINNHPTVNTGQLQAEMSKYRPGDVIDVNIIRDNKSRTIEVTLRNNQGDTSLHGAGDFIDLGCAFTPIPDETARQLGLKSGIQVTGVKDGKFKDAGIKDGFIILDINGTRVTTAEEVEKMYKNIVKSSDDHVMFISGIYPTGRKMYYAVPLAD